MKHTQEPWIARGEVNLVGNEKTGRTEHWVGGILTEGDYRGSICYIQSANHLQNGTSIEETEANARRIADCVNACAGMENPAEEIKRLRELAAQAQRP